MFVAKNRNGVDGIVYPMEIDTSRVHLRVLPPDEHSTIDAVVMKTKQEQDEHLRQKYKKFKANRDKKEQDARQQADDKKKQNEDQKSLKQGLRDLKQKLEEEKAAS